MGRLVSFFTVLAVIGCVLTIGYYKTEKVDNSKFNMAKAEEAHKKHVAEMAKLEEMRKQANMPKKVEEEEEAPKILVVLDTPQLERGSKLYGKCIVCHGKRGQGKKSQNAPIVGGQHDWYIVSSIKMMQTGERENAVMNPYIKNLSDEDIQDLAAYITKLPGK